MNPQVSGVVFYQSKKPSSRDGCVLYTLASGRTFSSQPDGSQGDRDPGTDGQFEQGQESGSVAAFSPAGNCYAYLMVPIDKLDRG